MGRVGVVADDAPTPIPDSALVAVDVRDRLALAVEGSIAGRDAILPEAVNDDLEEGCRRGDVLRAGIVGRGVASGGSGGRGVASGGGSGAAASLDAAEARAAAASPRPPLPLRLGAVRISAIIKDGIITRANGVEPTTN